MLYTCNSFKILISRDLEKQNYIISYDNDHRPLHCPFMFMCANNIVHRHGRQMTRFSPVVLRVHFP